MIQEVSWAAAMTLHAIRLQLAAAAPTAAAKERMGDKMRRIGEVQ